MTLRIKQLSIPASPLNPDDQLHQAVVNHLGIQPDELLGLEIKKKSLDARRKSKILYHYQLDVDLRDEPSLLRLNADLVEAPVKKVTSPTDGIPPLANIWRHKPIVVGSGPAGSFAALTLADFGQPCVVLERGDPVATRLKSVGKLRRRGDFDKESHYCFGEGGAGTFSDGKLTCGRNHPLIQHVFKSFVRFGAPDSILYDAHPHMGTDYLMRIAIKQRQFLESKGCEFRFRSRMVSFRSGGQSAKYIVKLASGEEIPTDHLILAIGHSARDTYKYLHDSGVSMVPKPFAIGARFEHPTEEIDRIQFGNQGNCILPTAEYKLAAQAGERGVWTFCMCPGGHLLPTSAEEGHLAINGMSYHARKSGFSNAAVVVNIRREDFFESSPLDGMYFQRRLERRAYQAGGGDYICPAQRLGDFLKGRKSQGELVTTYEPGVESYRMDRLLPRPVVTALRKALVDYDRRMNGFISERGLVVGLESKTSAPLSMPRGSDFESLSHPGLYPTGEGAGFAGGIISAALDGVRVGQAVLKKMVAESSANIIGANLT